MKKNESLKSFCAALKKHDHFLLTCHVSPEGDAIGSMLAVDSLLRRLGKKTTVVCEDAFPKRLSVLSAERWNQIHQVKKPLSYFKAVLTTDCPTLKRIGQVRNLITPEMTVFNIDHHVSNDFFGTHNYVKPNASSCGEVIYDLFKEFNLPIEKEEAKNLYVSLITDTGSFKHGSTTPASHRIAADLIETGIDLEKIGEDIYATYSLNKISLYGHILARVKTSAKGHVAWCSVRRSDLVKAGADYEDVEGFIDFLKYLREVKVVFVLLELPGKRKIRASFRCKNGYDVNKIATHFQGGGHMKAAGCTLDLTLSQAEQSILSVLKNKFGLK